MRKYRYSMILPVPIIILLTLLLNACTPEISSDCYMAENVGHSQQVLYGKIIKAKAVNVASHNDETGTLIGGATGATAGSAIGGGTRANILGALGGAVLGSIAGHEIGKGTGNQMGIQYIVHLDNGKTIAVVQGPRPMLHVGQHVMLLTGGRIKDRLVAA